MYYELYVDSLFLVNFVMNLYLLILVNGSMLRTATRRGLLLGACVGAACYLLPFFLPMPVWIKYPVGLLGGTWWMIRITFHPSAIGGYFKVFSCLLGYSLLMGGLLLFIQNQKPFGYRITMTTWMVCGVGAVMVMFIRYLGERHRKYASQGACRVTLIAGDKRVCVQALLDSGNGLTEPVSRKPVSVIDPSLYRALWEEERPFRAIPYRSIGCRRGILKGYLLPELRLEINGITKVFFEVYVAVAQESGGVLAIINPALLDG